jgi:hypothetical protein
MTEHNPNTYEPSAHLIATSGFTASQLSDQYLGQHIHSLPEILG